MLTGQVRTRGDCLLMMNRRRIGQLGLVFASCMASCSALAAAASGPVVQTAPFRMAMFRPETQFLGRWQRLIYREAFGRLGLSVEFRDLPGPRASVELEQGLVDGEGGRPASYATAAPQAIRLAEPLFEVRYVAFGKRPSSFRVKGWASLRGYPGIVCFKSGVHTTTTHLGEVLPAKQLLALPDTERGARMVAAGRCDLMADEELTLLSTLSSQADLQGLPLVHAGVLDTIGVYGYLHPRHAALAVKLGETISQMQKQGEIERMRRMTEKEFDIDPGRWQ